MTEFERDAAVALIRQIAEGELRPEHVDPYACDLITAHWPRVFANAMAAAGTIDRQAELKCRLALTDAAGHA